MARTRRMVGRIVLLALALAAGAPATAGAAARCEARSTAQAASATATGLAELAPNTARPTFDVALGDDTSRLDEELRLGRKGSTRLGDVTAVAVDVVDPPRASGGQLKGKLTVAATINDSKTRVVTYACITGGKWFDAGRYEGTLLFYGPRLQDFNYAIVVTTKWPWWVAALVLVGSALVFLVTAWGTKSLVFSATDNPRYRRVGTVLGVLFSIGAVAPVYWSSYLNNPTWGSEPGQQLLALAVAGLTAATAGLAAAHRILGGTQTGGGGGGGAAGGGDAD